MSWYYTYYLCRKDNGTGKLYPFGPFDFKGRFFPVLEKSKSFASRLYERFNDIRSADDRKMISEKLLEAVAGFSNDECKEFYDGEDDCFFSILSYKELPKGDYVKKGYCLIKDIETFERKTGDFKGFSDFLTPEIYAKKLENEIKLGVSKPVKDRFGYEYLPRTMSEYSFYMWVDYESADYEAHCIREAFDLIKGDLSNKEISEEVYVLLVQG